MKNIKPQTWFSAGCLLGCALMLFVGAAAPPKYLENGANGTTGTVFNVSVGASNVGVGALALKADKNINNTAVGSWAMRFSTNGQDDVAIGANTLTNTAGGFNVAVGAFALEQNDNGQNNVAIGYKASRLNVSGEENVTIGYFANQADLYTFDTVAIGYNALRIHDTGNRTTCIGANAGLAVPNAEDCTIVGYGALDSTSFCFEDTAIGYQSMADISNPTAANTAVGIRSLRQAEDCRNTVAIGWHTAQAVTQSTNNTFVGYDSKGANGLSNATALGSASYVGENNVMTLGNSSLSKVATSALVAATNGFASLSTLSTNAVGGTGYTNNQAINQTAIITGTAVAITIKNRAGTTILPATTISGTLPIPLQPGWAITAASGLTGTVVPF